MKKQPWCSVYIAGVSLTDFGLTVPSPFCSLTINNSEVDSYASWELRVIIGGDSQRQMNVAAFEALLYSSAQSAAKYENSSGIPVSFSYGWLDDSGSIAENATFKGWSISFQVSASDRFMVYTLTGYASLEMEMSMPVLNIPAMTGVVQPSAVVEGLAKAIKADTYYNLDIDKCDSPVLVNFNAMTTSFTDFVRGSYKADDDYSSFPGLLRLSKSYNATRDAAGLFGKNIKKLSQVLNNKISTPITSFLKKSLTDNTVQCSSFSYWVDEPTMTQLGTIHYKSNAGLLSSHISDTLEYGTSKSNVISISGSYNGIAYDMTDMNFASLGFVVDGSGNTIANKAQVVNSWSTSLAGVYQSSSIINDINVLATQFSGNFQVQVPGTTKNYKLAQPVSLVYMSGNTLSPISGIYNVMKVSHAISNTFITTLSLQRLTTSSASQTSISQGIAIPNATSRTKGYTKTKNVISTSKVDFGQIYPTMEHLVANTNTWVI